MIDVPDQPMTCDPATSDTACSIVRITGVFIDDPSLLCRFNEMKVQCSGCFSAIIDSSLASHIFCSSVICF